MGKRPSSRIRSIYFAIRNLLSNALLSEFGCSPAQHPADKQPGWDRYWVRLHGLSVYADVVPDFE